MAGAPRLILISAHAENGVIGAGEGMPWNVPAEYRQYLGFIAGQTVIMGRRTFEIFGEDLTSAHVIVVSRSVRAMPGAVVCGGVEEALERARSFGQTIFCAGGASLYAQMLPHADALYLSTIHGTFAGDAYFPDFDADEWRVTRCDEHPAFTFRVYERRR